MTGLTEVNRSVPPFRQAAAPRSHREHALLPDARSDFQSANAWVSMQRRSSPSHVRQAVQLPNGRWFFGLRLIGSFSLDQNAAFVGLGALPLRPGWAPLTPTWWSDLPSDSLCRSPRPAVGLGAFRGGFDRGLEFRDQASPELFAPHPASKALLWEATVMPIRFSSGIRSRFSIPSCLANSYTRMRIHDLSRSKLFAYRLPIRLEPSPSPAVEPLPVAVGLRLPPQRGLDFFVPLRLFFFVFGGADDVDLPAG